jgi:hypothetical protein
MRAENHKNRIRPAQLDSKMSNGRLFCRWQGRGLPEKSPAQRYSKMSNLKYLSLQLSVPRGPKTDWRILSKPDVFHINLFQRVEKYKFSVKFYLDILIQKLIFIKIR